MQKSLALCSLEGFPLLFQGVYAGLNFQFACSCDEPSPVLGLLAGTGLPLAILVDSPWDESETMLLPLAKV